jgi:sugar (pentulose or hexulose) kinase
LKDPLGVVYSHRSPDGHWLPGGASSVGAGVLAQQFPGRDLDALSAQAAERGPANAIAYPLAGRGERFPFHAPNAEGFLLGKPLDELDHYAALLQGVAFIERLCFAHLERIGAPTDGDLLLTGGGTKSRAWCQLRADILGAQRQDPRECRSSVRHVHSLPPPKAARSPTPPRPWSAFAKRSTRALSARGNSPNRINASSRNSSAAVGLPFRKSS